ncbi:hypothetical protein BD324DRAFT_639514 [Kockovaella imperatae]|uniref:Uncharacterized protein n=1 Tax=Kockovaella imperatae TaxID=4999 RepID=A0A1Y1U7H8_9TREE|nr:hypothetical protein BD324DRAFT_639514 [Kockovaella imperatae]ORX33476.1 hypothetical protein BD324DRAFT_639514 [Kockovaella imperatae]
MFSPTGLPFFRRPQHTRHTTAPASSLALQRSMLGTTTTYNLEPSPRSSRFDLTRAPSSARMERTISIQSFETMTSRVVEGGTMGTGYSDSPGSPNMTSWVQRSFDSMNLADDEAAVPFIPSEQVHPPAPRRLPREVYQRLVVLSEKSRFDGRERPLSAVSLPSSRMNSSRAGGALGENALEMLPLSPFSFGPVMESSLTTTPVTSPRTQNGDHLNLGQTGIFNVLPSQHPFATSLPAPPPAQPLQLREPTGKNVDRDKPLPPLPPSSVSAFPSDRYTDKLLKGLASNELMTTDDIQHGSFPPKRLVSTCDESQSFLSFGTNSPVTPHRSAQHDAASDECKSRGNSSEDDASLSKKEDSALSPLPKPPRPSRHLRPPPPTPSSSQATEGMTGIVAASVSMERSPIGGHVLDMPTTARDSSDTVRRTAVQRPVPTGRAVSLEDELFPTCLPSFHSRSSVNVAVGTQPLSSSESLVSDSSPAVQSRFTRLANASRLTLSDIAQPLGNMFRGLKRRSPPTEAAESRDATNRGQTGETLSTRPAPVIRRPTLPIYKRRSQVVYKDGYEPQEHFASIPRPETPVGPVNPTYEQRILNEMYLNSRRNIEDEDSERDVKRGKTMRGQLKKRMDKIRCKQPQGMW